MSVMALGVAQEIAGTYRGFEEKIEQPYITLTKTVIDNADTGESHEEEYHPTIKDISECWELRDNQGTWCSFRYPNQEMRSKGFNAQMADSNPSDPKIEVVNHFEARYNAKGDQFEYAQNILLGKQADDEDGSLTAEIGGATNAAASAYCRKKMTNLERLFDWLDSTDTKGVANPPVDLAEPVEFEVNAVLTDPDAIAAAAVTYSTREVGGVTKNFGTFTKDTVEYRRQKFFAEFEKHLDLHYCCTYFVMTELMLCYDSRGKNMMIASWGPREAGGDYIWYPIFYDIDTQLGLNNSGAYLWDYDADVTKDNIFSTPTSALWNNLYDLFYDDIVNKYRVLRGISNPSSTDLNINGSLTYQNIVGAYECNPDVFQSYAMRGVRPIIAIGLDEYYKFLAPALTSTDYANGKFKNACGFKDYI